MTLLHIYIDTETGEFPVYQGNILFRHPEISEQIEGSDIWGDAFPVPPRYALVSVPAEEHDPDTHKLEQKLPPVQVNGQWEAPWVAVPLTAEEKAERELYLAELLAQQEQAALDTTEYTEVTVQQLTEIP